MSNIENLRDLIIYQSQNNENISVEVLYDEEDFWLTQKSMSQLFNVEVNTINYHLKEIFKSEELNQESVIRKIRIVQNEGARKVSRELTFYSLDAIIAVGYRVNSKEATDFRIWATNTLKEYIKKGFVLNDEFSNSVNAFLKFRKYDILKDNGKVSRKQAEEKAEKEYNEFNKTQKIVSDFDKLLLETKKIEK